MVLLFYCIWIIGIAKGLGSNRNIFIYPVFTAKFGSDADAEMAVFVDRDPRAYAAYCIGHLHSLNVVYNIVNGGTRLVVPPSRH